MENKEIVKRYHLYARGDEVDLYDWLKAEAKNQDRSFNNMLWQAVKALKKAMETAENGKA